MKQRRAVPAMGEFGNEQGQTYTLDMLADEAEKNLIRLMEEVVGEGKAALGATNLREDVEGRWSWEKVEEKVVRRGVSREAIFSCQGKAVSVAKAGQACC